MNQLCIFECLTNGVIRCVLFLLLSPAAAASQRHTDVAADMYVRVRIRVTVVSCCVCAACMLRVWRVCAVCDLCSVHGCAMRVAGTYYH